MKNPTTYEVANEQEKVRKFVNQKAIRICLNIMQKNYALVPMAKELQNVIS